MKPAPMPFSCIIPRIGWRRHAASPTAGAYISRIDGIGGAMLSQTLATVRPFGIVASLGQAAGPIPPIQIEELSAPRAIGLARPSVLTYANDPDLYQQGAKALMAELQAGLINPISAEYALKDAARAHSDLEAGTNNGKRGVDDVNQGQGGAIVTLYPLRGQCVRQLGLLARAPNTIA